MGVKIQKTDETMTTLERQFAQTVAEHKSTIYTVCYMFSQDADEVNDLFQEVLIPTVICWLIWLTWEFYQKDVEVARYMIYGIACGAVIGAIVGFKMHFKTQRQYQDIINQIEDITTES